MVLIKDKKRLNLYITGYSFYLIFMVLSVIGILFIWIPILKLIKFVNAKKYEQVEFNDEGIKYINKNINTFIKWQDVKQIYSEKTEERSAEQLINNEADKLVIRTYVKPKKIVLLGYSNIQQAFDYLNA